MRAVSKKRLNEIESRLSVTEGDAWRVEAVRRMMPIIRGDGRYSDLSRKAVMAGTLPADAVRFEAEANAHLVMLCREHGEHRLADHFQSSHDTNCRTEPITSPRVAATAAER